MKIEKYNQYIKPVLEFNKWDVDLVKQLDDFFTVGIEYELCANEDPQDEPPVENYEKAAKYAKETTLLAIKRKMSYNFKFEMTMDEMEAFIDDVMEQVLEYYYDDEDEDVYDEILNVELYDTYTEEFIIDTLASNVMRFFDSQNMEYLIKRVKEKMPIFYKKYNRTFKYELEGDNEKQRILEFSPKTYVSGINNATQQLNMFFDEFEKQDYWYFNQRTALHFNVGIKSGKLNPLKGIILMSDFNRGDKTPFVFKGIEHRLPNIHVGSMLDKLKELLKGTLDRKVHSNTRDFEKLDTYREYIKSNIEKLDLHKLSDLEDFMNDLLVRANIDFWVKEFGLNITQYKKKYVEFRFVGGDVKRDVVLDKLYYFSYLTYAMSSNEYKQKEYIKGLYKFIEELKEIIK